jgi:hypothetical protein
MITTRVTGIVSYIFFIFFVLASVMMIIFGSIFIKVSDISLKIHIIVVLYCITTALIFWCLARLMKYLQKENPFTMPCVKYLRYMGILFGILFVIDIFRLSEFSDFTFLTYQGDKMLFESNIPILILLILGVICFAIAEVFKRAIQYKEENDLTI